MPLFVRAGLDGGLRRDGVWVDGRPLAGRLELEPAVAVRVEAVLGGTPLGGAPARFRWDPGQGAAPRLVLEATTDRDGVAVGDGLPEGRYVVEVEAAPGVVGQRALEAREDVTVRVELPPLGRWTGRVTDAATGAPLAAEVVLTVGIADGVARGATTADGQGVFAVTVPRGAPRQLFVSHPGYLPMPSRSGEAVPIFAALARLRAEDVVRDVALTRGGTLAGVVVGGDPRAPVPGLRVAFTAQGFRPPAEVAAPLPSATTGDDGGFVVQGLAPGDYFAAVTTPGWYVEGDARVRVPRADADGAAPRVELVVRGAGVVTGTVVRPDGTPVPAARVWLAGGGGVVRAARQAGRFLETLTRDDGGFALDDVPPLDWIRVRAAAGDDETAPSAAFRIADAAPAPFRLVLGPTAAFTGTVLDLATREPVAGARVTIDAVGPPDGRGRAVAVADAAGRFRSERLVPGAWKLTPALRSLYLPAPGVDVVLDATRPTTEVPLQLDPGYVVAGVVLDAAGAPVVGARMVLSGREDAGAPPRPVDRRGRTGADGGFRLTGLASGSYALEARSGGLRARVEGLRGGERSLVLRLAR